MVKLKPKNGRRGPLTPVRMRLAFSNELYYSDFLKEGPAIGKLIIRAPNGQKFRAVEKAGPG